jgi:hypothetical protein
MICTIINHEEKNMHFKLTKYMMNKMPHTSSGDHACLINWVATAFVRES